jgi:hypothetical protein
MARRAVTVACLSLLACVFSLGVGSSKADAITCAFLPAGNSMVLLADCETTTTILVPDGMTLDGNGHSITAIQPALGPAFTGAIVQNEGAVMHVTNLTLRAQIPGNPCDAGEARLRGILFYGASGTATNNRLFDISQVGTFGCQEGNGIEARNFTDENMFSTSRTTVTISDNDIERYQKTGVLISGNVDAIVTRNVIRGVGPSTEIAQNGVQIGFGATGLISANQISGNNYTPNTFWACGIIIVDADGVDRKQQDNLFPPTNDPFANEKDTCGFAKGGNYEPFGK